MKLFNKHIQISFEKQIFKIHNWFSTSMGEDMGCKGLTILGFHIGYYYGEER